MFGEQALQFKCMEVFEECKQENHLKLKVTFRKSTNQYASEFSVHKINSSVNIQIKILFTKLSNTNNPTFGTNPGSNENIFVLFKFVKNNSTDKSIHSITCSSAELKLSKTYLTDNDSWYLVNETKASCLDFKVALNSKLISSYNPFQALYDDTELTDFKLIGEGEAMVHIHGAVLAAQSPTVMKMIKNRSIKDGVIEYSGVQKETLQHFKDFLYLSTLPNDNLTHLLVLAVKAGMPVLEQKCIEKIVSTMTAANIYSLTEFAQQNKLYDLYVNILDDIQAGKVKVSDIRKCIMSNV